MTTNKCARLEVEEVEEEQSPELRERLARFPAHTVKKGEDFIALQFPPNFTPFIKIDYSHQLLPDGMHCGWEDIQVRLKFNETWSCVEASESGQRMETGEESALEQIKAKLPQLFLPPPTAVVEEDWGEEIAPALGEGGRFSMYFQTAPKRALFERCHAMSTFFIECASQVENFNLNWRMLSIVEQPQQLLAAFCTIYEFTKPIQDTKSWRICVLLVLPQYQRLGLAQRMIRTVYDLAARERNVTEITVEDPCAAFTRVRHKVEMDLCKNSCPFRTLRDFETATAKQIAAYYQDELRMSRPSAQFCFECSWYRLLTTNAATSLDEDALKTFRLRVKARLRREMINLPDAKLYPVEFKQALQEEYELVEAGFKM